MGMARHLVLRQPGRGGSGGRLPHALAPGVVPGVADFGQRQQQDDEGNGHDHCDDDGDGDVLVKYLKSQDQSFLA